MLVSLRGAAAVLLGAGATAERVLRRCGAGAAGCRCCALGSLGAGAAAGCRCCVHLGSLLAGAAGGCRCVHLGAGAAAGCRCVRLGAWALVVLGPLGSKNVKKSKAHTVLGRG